MLDYAITLRDYAQFRLPGRETYTSEECDSIGVPFINGCSRCHALLSIGGAYPCRDGTVKCEDHIGRKGAFNCVEAYHGWLKQRKVRHAEHRRGDPGT